MEDNFHLDSFKARMSAAHKTPLIAINMGAPGRLSRVLNGFLTPVSHPCLPEVAAPGQMSAAEIWQGLTLLGEVKPLSFYLVGTPISQSRSPALHNSLFQRTGLPHRYELRETNQEIDFRSMLQSDGFGGASVTIPLKQQVTKIVDALTPAAKKIGAVNTVVPLDDHIRDPKCPRRFLGDNTDWKGIVYVLSQKCSVHAKQWLLNTGRWVGGYDARCYLCITLPWDSVQFTFWRGIRTRPNASQQSFRIIMSKF
ncbi:hypothetical protein DCS_08304 [Drechmeria coniospora]|uniref:Shikimate dehydrogenase substrate binding N-terminal domain-containing protein n=1 Tax=Drechmeria coniospora TaxID=98403 RepID=A0A151G9T0_DRECN|nr:uncharacterized protein DCS_08304 [Drechmeria coniospora]KYK53925.1 hypothetical protein DCS_08304 [Drechmeria coniospora]